MNIKESVLAGKIPENLRILDSHAHLGEGEQGGAYVRSLPVEESLRLSKKIGVSAIVASSLKSLYGNVLGGNDRMMEFTKMYPGYVYASIFYDPHYHSQCIDQLEQYRTDPGFVGVKIHPRDTGTTIVGRDYDKLYEYCIRKDILVACHTWQTEPANNPADYEPVLDRYPELKLQLCHMGGTYQGCMDSIRLANKYEHVYLDINGSLYSQIWLEDLIKEAPMDRFVFGTDQTFNDPRIMIGRVLLSDLTDEQKQLLLCDNFEKAIGRKLVK
jgi:predicted TIM-barrel fold metal-dependent hydrolase